MRVLDASVAITALLEEGPARATLRTEQLHAPQVIDLEVAHVLRRRVLSGRLDAEHGRAALATWQRLQVGRHEHRALLDRIWELRDNVSAYEAAYVALAESLGCALLTADHRLAAAPGPRCPITVMPA